ncbi:hypothetical protein C2S52_004258 [Perilla frutescens var. hirtella]|nr:hypothetical protein C2S52_004258 [Perilla frutescens var. hirtella]
MMILSSMALVVVFSLVSICRGDDDELALGFTVDLIHKDSLQSPSFNPSSSSSQRLANSLLRSFIRKQNLNRNRQLPHPDIINSGGEYFMKYSVGTPPVPSFGTADTGSELTWTQCQPCRKCFNQTLPIFAPKSSSTYRLVRCNTPQCNSFQGTSCPTNPKKYCLYSETYGDGSFSAGALSTDTITLASAASGGAVSVPRILFGCGFTNGDQFASGQSGIVGLGGGKGSFVRQLGPLAQGKFSYCLVPLSDDSNSSKLNFGASGVVSGFGAVSTPLVRKLPETFYFLTLEGISVGSQRLEFYEPQPLLADSKQRVEGNIIIDSGTTLTLLPPDLYAKVEKAMRSRIKLKTIKDPLGVLSLCYVSREDFGVPDVTVHFRGADVKLERENVFVRTSEDTVCLAAAPARGVAIYGNLAQTNFLVGYDLVKRTVSFKRADCGK